MGASIRLLRYVQQRIAVATRVSRSTVSLLGRGEARRHVEVAHLVAARQKIIDRLRGRQLLCCPQRRARLPNREVGSESCAARSGAASDF